jgi:type I restriction enzyme S subunit
VVLSPAKVPSTFLYCLLATQEFTDYLDARATGAAYPAVRPDDFEAALLVLPSHQPLAGFHQHVEPWLEQRYVLDQELRRLAEARDYLLPKRLSGEVEVEAAVHESNTNTRMVAG